MATSTKVLENIKRNTRTTVDAFNAWDYKRLVSMRSKDFVMQILPTSLESKPMNNDQFEELWKNFLTPTLKKYKMSPQTLSYDAENRRSVVYSLVSADLPGVGHRKYEFIQTFQFSEDGEEMVRMEEFFDSKVYVEMMEEMKGVVEG